MKKRTRVQETNPNLCWIVRWKKLGHTFEEAFTYRHNALNWIKVVKSAYRVKARLVTV